MDKHAFEQLVAPRIIRPFILLFFSLLFFVFFILFFILFRFLISWHGIRDEGMDDS